ncbi:GNAT family N-acetyltransferase [Marivita sp. S6314]|uniref:GNAT family N-acetyltransferase n=1 Tax=Marivita sp. S6314 TaxID=2926406 RepID=UPI001FF61E38|nr:GNAT family N-acetyltransferase [Marivita sp. S6314]MCK0151194.1 GNAT family N-acetyltransferase [Marivita sp. S6314]
MTQMLDHTTHALPLDAMVASNRLRSDGILCHQGLRFCKEQDIPKGFDPLQGGWVPLDVIDDLAPASPDSVPGSLDLRLRNWALSDAPRYVALLDDPKLWEALPEPYPDPLTLDMAEALIDLSNNSNHHRVFAVLNQGVPVGQIRVAFDGDDTESRTAEISYWIGRDHWGQGIASAVVSSFARRCLADDPNLSSLIARVKDGNAASFRVLQKAGFAIDGPDRTPGWTRLRKAR